MEKITWQVEYTSLPRVKKYCKKCRSKSEFLSSELFRVNANQKKLDIWLIYNCLECKTTWKQELFQRVKLNALSDGILEKFHCNDAELAYTYAMNCNQLSKIGFEIINPTFSIVGDEINFTNPIKRCYEILLLSDFEFDIKISSIFKEKLNLSNSQFEILIKNKQISCNTNRNVKRCKLQKKQFLSITV